MEFLLELSPAFGALHELGSWACLLPRDYKDTFSAFALANSYSFLRMILKSSNCLFGMDSWSFKSYDYIWIVPLSEDILWISDFFGATLSLLVTILLISSSNCFCSLMLTANKLAGGVLSSITLFLLMTSSLSLDLLVVFCADMTSGLTEDFFLFDFLNFFFKLFWTFYKRLSVELKLLYPKVFGSMSPNFLILFGLPFKCFMLSDKKSTGFFFSFVTFFLTKVFFA
jgi:hypothetical protein